MSIENTVKLVEGSGVGTDVRIQGTPDNGRSKRISADGTLSLSVASTETNENPGFTTRKSNFRITKRSLDANGKPVFSYFQGTLSVITDRSIVSVADVCDLVDMGANFLMHGENSNAYTNTNTGVDGTHHIGIDRLLAGEV